METIRVESQQLGTIEISADQLLRFSLGVPGFPGARRFCLVAVRAGSRFKLLQCVDRFDLAFVLADPLELDPTYPVDQVRRQAGHFGLGGEEQLVVGVTVTVPPPPERPTANMLAPLVMGLETGLGAQVILHDNRRSVRHLI